jgi:curved DNA-binding protein CbpA
MNYYEILGINPSANNIEIRRAYLYLSKQYHPDTTELPPHVAKVKFQEVNAAYATLTSPQQRIAYDAKIGYSASGRIQAPPDVQDLNFTPANHRSSHRELDAIDRPLSSGEIFMLFLLCLTLGGCLVLVLVIAWWRGEF